MPRSYYALITPLVRPGGGERPDNTLPGQQPGGGERPDQGLPPFPSHPIVIPPDGIAPGVPTHPIYIPPIPDQGLPPFPSFPIVIPPDGIAPGVPSQPIYLPIYPDQGLPGEQPGIDNSLPGGQGGRPDQGLPGEQPGIDNSLPPVIQFPPLPDPIPDEAEAIVLVKARGQEAVWMFVTDQGELLPPEGSPMPTPHKTGKRK
jgi:hypothetical protein